jgi:hypothetical protein
MLTRNPPIPIAIAAERRPVLERALRHLPARMLHALRDGIDRSDGRLRAGGLFSATGDCPVGAMLRELHPRVRSHRGLLGLSRACGESITDEHPALARAVPRLTHVEVCFDVTVRRCQEVNPVPGEHVWAQVVGRWFADCVTAELERRERVAQMPSKKSSPSELSSFVASEFSRVYSSV